MKKILAIILALLCLGSALAAEVVTTGNVNLRVGPGLDYDVLASVPADTRLEYLSETSVDERGVAWFLVAYGDGEAWISSRYSQLADGAAPAVEDARPAIPVNDFSGSAELLPLYRTDLLAAAYALNLPEYARVENSEVPNRYSDDALMLAGNTAVECIVLSGAGYTFAGAGVGMDAAQAKAALLAEGLTLIGDSDTRMDFEYPGKNAYLLSVGGFGGIVYVGLENGLVSSIDLESYTG